MQSRRALQQAKYLLRQWRFFERNFQEMQGRVKTSALSLFKALKQLDKEEVNWLAERYYKSQNEAVYSEYLGEYTTVIPVPYIEIAKVFNCSEKTVQEELKRIERRLGFYILEYQAEYEQKEAKDSLARLRTMIDTTIDDREERVILLRAVRAVEDRRVIHSKHNSKQFSLMI